MTVLLLRPTFAFCVKWNHTIFATKISMCLYYSDLWFNILYYLAWNLVAGSCIFKES